MRKTLGILTVFVAALFGAQGAFADQLVTNGGFETGDFTGWTTTGPVTTSAAASQFYGVDTIDAASGTYGAYLGSELSQLTLSQSLTVAPSHSYTISFSLAQDSAILPNFINSFAVTLGGQTVFSEFDAPVTAFKNYTFTFATSSSAPASEVLSFVSENDLGYFSLDNVSVSTTVTPEPATLLLIAPALCVVGLIRRKKIAQDS
jgi:hypothetical protein